MIELSETHPDVNVRADEYIRLLGYPHSWVLTGRVLTGRAAELAEAARCWYREHGRPWIFARYVPIEDARFSSSRLQKTLDQAGAHGAFLVAVSAGPELEEQARRLWQEDKPDEYFFLEVFGSALVEHLTTSAGAALCAWADGQGMAVLPHYSPGYPEWDIADQPKLLERITAQARHALPGMLEVLESGALRPKKSLLAVFGLTRNVERVRRLTPLNPCAHCAFTPCQYRRAPYRQATLAGYSVNLKALKRWSLERLALQRRDDGSIEARFRYDGTTCTNMGHPLAFDYVVKLGPRQAGYPILEQQCSPVLGDKGHTMMCGYLDHAAELMAAIQRERPLAGQRLDGVLSWPREACAAGCYCDPAARQHKWGLVLETIHYALEQEACGADC
ncbi:MAG TPA: hypothetical protein VNY05_37250 [Candidatus Acidoferrales bacterium]|jgi:hypothetical protein|nr:hypothetical protein [Candidatus Acidoferrales bacterium]